ncbi:MAG: hypothetical protein IJY17_02910 [Alphaproteobacteria bacterium]|nr:hypothetical protein [Alphaproteobacteria bacterium]
MTDKSTRNQIKPYCDISEALEWIAFGWPAFENRADRIPFEKKQRFDGKTFRFAKAQLKQAVLNRNLEVTGIPYSRCRTFLLPLFAVTFLLYFITCVVIVLPINLVFKLFKVKPRLISPFSYGDPERVIPRLYFPIERFYKYTFKDLPYCPEQSTYASKIPEKHRSKWRVEPKDKTFENEYLAKHFAEEMNLPLPEREDNRRMMTDKEKISAIHSNWNEITFSSFGFFAQGLTRIEIPTDQLQVLFPLALTQTENKSFSETLEELDYVSPYMLVMKDVIEELKISKTNQPVKKIVEHAVIECGKKRNIEISQRFAEYIAQAIRLPEAQKGGAPKTAETKK